MSNLRPPDPLSLRASVGTLVRVIFQRPHSGEWLLALERKATLGPPGTGQRVRVSAQPFGGAVRLARPAALRGLIGDFRFDSRRSADEQDFRLLIRPTDWPAVRTFCLQHLAVPDDSVLEADPARELAEELADALGFTLKPAHYRQRPLGLVAEDQPAPTGNPRALGLPTVRIYRTFEVEVTEAALAQALLANSQGTSDAALRERALADYDNGGRGRANGALVVPLSSLRAAYQARRATVRGAPFIFEDHELEANVAVVLEDATLAQG